MSWASRMLLSALAAICATVLVSPSSCADPENRLTPYLEQQGNTIQIVGTAHSSATRNSSKSQYVDPGYRPPYPYDASPSHPNFTQWQNAIAACPENEQIMNCLAQFNDLLKPISGGTYRPPTRNQIEGAARQAILRMNLPLPTPHIGPDPTTNEWNMAVVGYPLWWTVPALVEGGAYSAGS